MSILQRISWTKVAASAAMIALLASWFSGPAVAADESAIVITIKNHRFIPPEVTVPAGKRVELIIENHDPTPEEFESDDLRREKIVAGNGKISLWVGPLPEGSYRFFGEFNKETAQGNLIVK